MELILTIIALGVLTNFITWAFGPLQWFKKKLKLNYTLLNCSICLGFWIGFLFALIFVPYTIGNLCLYGFLTSLASSLIEKHISI